MGGENGPRPNLTCEVWSVNKIQITRHPTKCSHSSTKKRLMKIHVRRWNAGESGMVSQIFIPYGCFFHVDTLAGFFFSTRNAHPFNDLFTSNYIHMSEKGTFLIKGNQQSGRVRTFIHIQRSTLSSPHVRRMRFLPNYTPLLFPVN